MQECDSASRVELSLSSSNFRLSQPYKVEVMILASLGAWSLDPQPLHSRDEMLVCFIYTDPSRGARGAAIYDICFSTSVFSMYLERIIEIENQGARAFHAP